MPLDDGPPVRARGAPQGARYSQKYRLIAVGLAVLGVSLGGMFNIFLLTYKEHLA
jgi:hypothetical protein